MAKHKTPILIKRIKKGGHDGHHRGAWKVAYADFVTAMMAFFLLLWLLNSTTQEQKRGISAYFGSVGDSIGAGGLGGIMGGLSIEKDGNFRESRTSAIVDMGQINNNDEVNRDKKDNLDENNSESTTQTGALKEKKESTSSKEQAQTFSKEQAQKELANAEHKMFQAAEKRLREAIEKDPALKNLKDNLLMDETPEGLRIQIIDRDPVSMFPNGSAEMYPHTRQLLKQVASVIQKLPNGISVTGHTDAKPYSRLSPYTNWELSSDRANATRRVLMESQIPDERIRYVVGKADRDPLLPANPMADQNRRISITLLRNYPMPKNPISKGVTASSLSSKDKKQ
jgi:chemotaxis protein MotB